jgi:hypothetical protein
MKQAIAVCTAVGREHIFDSFASIFKPQEYPFRTYLIYNGCCDKIWEGPDYTLIEQESNHFELGAIKAMLNTDVDEFFFLHDSCEIKSREIFNLAFEMNGSVAYGPYWSGYIGKYQTSILRQMDIPLPVTKEEAIEQEFKFTRAYAKLAGIVYVMDPNFKEGNPSNHYEEKFGRKNLVLEGKWIRKYQGTWGQWVGEIPT